jgi:L-amino acid N-acyltransferase YncA
MSKTLRPTKFRHVDLTDDFFDSLKAQYKEFSTWFARKADEPVYVIDDDDGSLRGFVYLKVETGAITDVTPPLPAKRRLKVGTLKVEAKGTKLGERIVKRIFDHALLEGVAEVYVTVFDTHVGLINLFKRYGFAEVAKKATPNGEELVLVRRLDGSANHLLRDYPLIHVVDSDKWLLAIYPDYHTSLFPDSILRGESPDLEQDVPHTNTIHKVYIAKMILTRMRPGDLVVIYRTTDIPGRARYRSVATSVCVVEETRARKDFANVDEFLDFARDHSVFSEDELRSRFESGERLYAVKLTYNIALPRRPIRQRLLDDVGIGEFPRWDLRRITDEQFSAILDLGETNESYVVD